MAFARRAAGGGSQTAETRPTRSERRRSTACGDRTAGSRVTDRRAAPFPSECRVPNDSGASRRKTMKFLKIVRPLFVLAAVSLGGCGGPEGTYKLDKSEMKKSMEAEI